MKKIFSGLIVLISVVVLISSIIYLAPVDPTRLTFGQRSDNQTVLQKQKELGLDQPLHRQLVHVLTDFSPLALSVKKAKYEERKWLSFSLGERILYLKRPYLRESYQSGRPVAQMMKAALPKTVVLALSAFVFASLIGIALGLISALYKGSRLDRWLIVVSTLGISVPSYVSAVIFSIVFGYLLSHITGLNMQGSIFEIDDYGDNVVVWKNLLLPALALGIRPISIVMQLSRSAVLDVMGENYVKTAKAKGLPFNQVLLKHVLRNAMNPITTSLSGWLASLLAGAFFVEQVFNYKGLGQMTITALIQYDVPVILACILFISAVFITVNILTDYLYGVIDPRVAH